MLNRGFILSSCCLMYFGLIGLVVICRFGWIFFLFGIDVVIVMCGIFLRRLKKCFILSIIFRIFIIKLMGI